MAGDGCSLKPAVFSKDHREDADAESIYDTLDVVSTYTQKAYHYERTIINKGRCEEFSAPCKNMKLCTLRQ
ncbi:unnamed protein product, partial [Trichogramma brassicae]